MSLAPSIPSIKVKVGRIAPPPPYRACKSFAVIRSSKAEGPRRPTAPPLSPPPPMPPKTPALSTPPSLSQPPTPVKPAQPSPPPPETKPAVAAAATPPVGGVVTFEYQRKVAKELQEYFKKKKLEETNQGPFFGWLAKNEIANGRWAMFGFAVGMLTEYATGSDFVEQMKILLSNFGIVDLD
ncbi:hypothetical protein CFC21_041378 [Triticum aestivum]|uniref:Uncharacterized protein n=3 Tax=Triticum TaxID=4564 RepID=A0A9R1FIT7_WHEAT|nr:light-harvesting complex-like protein OHP2, chloroplastic [Triticum dicoccoides]XP_044348970.1 light-harvesting complex-like protein OHP2, chloroplastic [Triticum aestivum]KAF7029691.1 hypothetical protein CFC21_041378 [Triticum aestivum]CDM82245.1 unnamed protein product [Triticum aestivum]VAH77242.1 unnamed protein product [Triticum turgidum subsp. durum]